jgi:hypothetical protein
MFVLPQEEALVGGVEGQVVGVTPASALARSLWWTHPS